jgi:hypothetical protein
MMLQTQLLKRDGDEGGETREDIGIAALAPSS